MAIARTVYFAVKDPRECQPKAEHCERCPDLHGGGGGRQARCEINERQ